MDESTFANLTGCIVNLELLDKDQRAKISFHLSYNEKGL